MPIRCIALAAVVLAATAAHAQDLTTVRASPHARVEQTVGLSVVSVDFHRPGVRDRVIWGELVPYGEIWRGGANENTVFETSTDVQVEGRTLPAGRYGLHTLPTDGTWTVVFSTMADAWGSYSYDPAEDALRVTVTPRPAPMNERLLYRFDDVTDSTTTLVLHWEQLEVPIHLEVATIDIVLASMERELRGQAAFEWETWDQAAAYALAVRRRLEDALVWEGRSLDQRPTFLATMTRAAILDELGRREEAATARSAALDMDMMEPDLNTAGRRMLDARVPAYAVTVYERSVHDFPESWAAHFGLARALEAAGDRARAAEHYTHAREMAPEDRRPMLDEAIARVRAPLPTR